MSERNIKRRLFLPHRYKNEEKYLASMALKGYALSAVKRHGVMNDYVFLPCKAKPHTYVVDFVMPREISEFYLNAYKEAGFEFVCSISGEYGGRWVYFKSECIKKPPKIDEFTKMNLFDKLYKKWGFIVSTVFFVYVMALYTAFGRFSNRALVGFTAFSAVLCAAVFVVLFTVSVYCVAGLYVQRNKCIKRMKE